MIKLKDHVRSFIYAIRPFETAQHFAMTIAGYSFSAYLSGTFNLSLRSVFGLLAIISFLCQVLSYNNYATFDEDIKDSNKKFDKKFKGINKKYIFWISVVFFIFSVGFSLLVDLRLSFFLIILMIIWAMYTHPVVMLKKGRFLPYIFDMLTMPFLVLVGCYLNGFVDYRCVIFAIFFGLTEIAGHLNHMTIDYQVDKETKINTLAVRKGPLFTFTASTIFFIIAPIYFIVLGIYNILPIWVSLIYIPGTIIHLFKFIALMKKFSFRYALTFRTAYRIMYLVESTILEIYLITNIVNFNIFK